MSNRTAKDWNSVLMESIIEEGSVESFVNDMSFNKAAKKEIITLLKKEKNISMDDPLELTNKINSLIKKNKIKVK